MNFTFNKTFRGIISGARLFHTRNWLKVNKMAQSDSALQRPLVAVCQMTSTRDKEENFMTCKRLISRAKARGAQMVFLPEAFDYIADSTENTIEMAEYVDGDIMNRFKELAKDTGLWLSLGGFHEKVKDDGKKIMNSHLILDAEGSIVAKYSKTHLFDVTLPSGQKLQESNYVEPGKELVTPVETPVGRVGLTICYDLRFPEQSLLLTQWGSHILTYPSAFTQATGMAHWEVLLRSRAIENQCYVIAAAQTGQHNSKRVSYGHAMVVDPWGCVVACCKEGEDVAFAEIDLEYVKNVRDKLPVSSHRRHDLYKLQTEGYGKEIPISEWTPFKFGEHTIPASCIFYRTSLTVAFVNLKPFLPGHMVLSPQRQIKRFFELSQMEMADLYESARKIERALAEEFGSTSANIALQDGPEAGQSVNHLHLHIVPRKKGDLERSDDIHEWLEGKEQEKRKPRTLEEMSQEAERMRKYFQSLEK